MINTFNAHRHAWLLILLLIAVPKMQLCSQNQAKDLQRILIITGGHDFEREAFFEIFEKMPAIDYQEWEEFEHIIGGRYIQSEQGGSTYRHDVDIPVQVVDKHHPVTKGLNDFIIHDEVYGNFRVRPGVDPLLKTTHPESGEIVAWTNTYGNSRIVYIQLGHDHHAYKDPNFQKILKQAIDWVL